MQVSTKGRYGLRAIVDIAIHKNEGPLALRVIAERQDISESYLEQMFTSLRKTGLIRASRGAQGGYELSRPAEKITVGDVLRSLEGPIVPVFCVDNDCSKECGREKICMTRPFWEEFKVKINEYLDSVTIQDLADKAAQLQPEELMFYI